MDSGTPLDIVNVASIAGHRSKVRKIERIVMDTANGHNVADKGIDLVVELLGQNILPYVLDSSPNVLSLGRRCVVDGYGWYWPPYSLSPYLVHPVTGEYIYMRVEDYCPYLDNHRTHFPDELSSISAACSTPHRSVATASVAPRATAAPGKASSSTDIPLADELDEIFGDTAASPFTAGDQTDAITTSTITMAGKGHAAKPILVQGGLATGGDVEVPGGSVHNPAADNITGTRFTFDADDVKAITQMMREAAWPQDVQHY